MTLREGDIIEWRSNSEPARDTSPGYPQSDSWNPIFVDRILSRIALKIDYLIPEMINSYLNAQWKKIALGFGLYVTRQTDEIGLSGFFSLINPIATEHTLLRLGDQSDGGYLVPDDLNGLDACFSPGVSQEASFEADVAKLGVPCYMADYSVDNSPIRHALFDFEKRYLGSENDGVYITLEHWINLKQPNGKEFILQMDIEGSEYGVILTTPHHILQKFRIVVIEFHHLNDIFCPAGLQLIRATFQKLLQIFDIVHIHPNNCSSLVGRGYYQVPPVMEFTFLRKDRIFSVIPAVDFPHALDVKNAPNLPDIVLPDCWRQVRACTT